MLPATKLAENEDWPGAPPVRRVKLAFWKDPVNRLTTPLPRSPVTLIEPPGLKIMSEEVVVEAVPVVQLIIPLAMLAGEEKFSCAEVSTDERPNVSGVPESDQFEPAAVFELKDIVSALAGMVAAPTSPMRAKAKTANRLIILSLTRCLSVPKLGGGPPAQDNAIELPKCEAS